MYFMSFYSMTVRTVNEFQRVEYKLLQFFNFQSEKKTQTGVRRFSHLLHSFLINSCSVDANLLPSAICINYAPVWIREDLLDRGRLRVAGIFLINDDHDNPLFY